MNEHAKYSVSNVLNRSGRFLEQCVLNEIYCFYFCCTFLCAIVIFLCNIKQVELSQGMIVSASEVQDCILKLEKGKAPGLDGLSNEALVYAGTRLSVL